MIVGPANCGKTFLLQPLSTLFNVFCNPATTSYAWLGVENSEVIILNDFRWSKEIISWSELFLLLEGNQYIFLHRKHNMEKIFVWRKTLLFSPPANIP